MQQTACESPPAKERTPRPGTRLDTLETTLTEQYFLLDSNGVRKQRLIAARLLLTTTVPQRERRAQRIMECGSTVSVREGAEGPYVCASRCRDRLCPECQRAKARKLADTITERMDSYTHPKFITFTLRRTDAALGDQITRVIGSFRRLRSRKLWKDCVTRGIYAVEWDQHKHTKQWRAHIHCLVDSKFIDKRWLQKTWLEITGDSFIVDIRVANENTPRYIAKYMAKTITSETLTEELWSLAMELKGRRLSGKFGQEPKLNEDEDPNTDPIIGSLASVIEKAKAGDPNMIRVLQQLCLRYNLEPPPEIRLPVDDT